MNYNEIFNLWQTGNHAELAQTAFEESKNLFINPVDKHLPDKAGPYDSVFSQEYDSWEKILALLSDNHMSDKKEINDYIFITVKCFKNREEHRPVGIQRDCVPVGGLPLKDTWTVVKDGADLKLKGPASVGHQKWWQVTLAFKKYAEDYYLLVDVSPSTPTYPGDFSNLKPGDVLDKFEVGKRLIGEVIPTVVYYD